MRAQVKIVFGQEYTAAIFGDEGMGMSEFAAGFIHLEASAAGEPNGGDTGVIEGGCEFVESRGDVSAGWN